MCASLPLSINQWRHGGDTLFPGREKILIFLGQRCFFLFSRPLLAAMEQGLLLEETKCRTKPAPPIRNNGNEYCMADAERKRKLKRLKYSSDFPKLS